MKKLILTMFFVLLITMMCFPQWVQTKGPYGGPVQALAALTNESGHTNLFAGTGSGVYLSTNYGTNWTPANTPFSNFYQIVQVGSIIFAGTETGVFKLTNNNSNWTAVNNGLMYTDVKALAVSDTNLFAGTGGGVFLSTNGGTNWSLASLGLPKNYDSTHYGYISALTVFSNSKGGTNLFAGTEDGVFLSTNNGTSWSPASQGLPIYYDTLFIFPDTNKHLRPHYGNVSAFAFSHNDTLGTNLFAAYSGGVFLSTNNGENWTLASEGLPTYTWDTTRYKDVFTLAISPDGKGGTNIFAGTLEDGVFLSTNNCASWTAVNKGLIDNYINALVVSPNGTGSTNLFAGTRNSIFFSTNNGTSWIDINNGLQYRSVITLAVSGSNLFAGTYGGGIFRSTNGGTIWNAINNGLTDTDVNDLVVFPDGTGNVNIFAALRDSGIFLSTNNGTNWTAVNNGLTDKHVNALVIFTNETGSTNIFAGTGYGGGRLGGYLGEVFFSTNKGTSWNSVSNGLKKYTEDIATLGTNLFVGTYDSGIFLSTNSGESWTAINDGLTNKHITALAVSSNGIGDTNIFAGTDDGVFLSTNNGTSWTLANTPFSNFSQMIQLGSIHFAGTRDGVFKSINNGISWNAVNDGLTNTDVRTLVISGSNLYAGTYDEGVWWRPLSEMINNIENEKKLPAQFSLSQNYPNPFNPSTTINYSIPKQSYITLKVYDILGREFTKLVNEEKPAGNYQIEFNAANLPSGVYFYRIQAGSFNQVRKMLLIK